MEEKKSHFELVGKIASEQRVRQNRYTGLPGMGINFKNEYFKIVNYSYFGFGIESKKSLDNLEYLENCNIEYLDTILLETNLKVVRKEKLGDVYNYGLELLNGNFPIDSINLMLEIKNDILAENAIFEKEKLVQKEFIFNVLELERRLDNYRKIVEKVEAKNFKSIDELDEASNIVINNLAPEINDLIAGTNNILKNHVDFKNKDLLKLSLNFYREVLGKHIFKSAFTKRSFEKPRGYAGDFEMMNQIYKNDSYGKDLYSRTMEKAVNLHAEPQAVRNRSEYLSDKILQTIQKTDKTKKINILSVACGPAEEIKKSIQKLKELNLLENVTFYLLDQDLDALQFAQRNIKDACLAKNCDVNLKLLNIGIKELLGGKLENIKFDLIYSAGLFDYFSDPVASRIGKILYSVTNTNGRMIIGNFNISSPNWFGMLSLFDWNLILRSEDDLARIFKFENANLTIESELENVNLFCNILKN